MKFLGNCWRAVFHVVTRLDSGRQEQVRWEMVFLVGDIDRGTLGYGAPMGMSTVEVVGCGTYVCVTVSGIENMDGSGIDYGTGVVRV